jgi:PilZ domain
MSLHRPEPRLETDLTVRVWGMDANGKPFFQNVRARNVSNHGALISGIDHALEPGDVVGVQFEQCKARFRVVWIMDSGGLQKNQAGLQLLDNQDCPWKNLVAEKEISDPQARPSNRRRLLRHKISFSLELHDERTNIPLRVSATDISGNGCYVETILPMAVGTVLKAEFWVEAERVNTTAVVRTCDPGVGMGIEFLTLSPDLQERFQHLLDKLDPAGISGPVTPG